MKMIPTASKKVESAKKLGELRILPVTGVYLNLAQGMSEHLTFPLPAFKSGIQCSRNDSAPVIWIISLYL